MKNDDVFSIGTSDELLGIKGKSETRVPLNIKELSWIKIKVNKKAAKASA